MAAVLGVVLYRMSVLTALSVYGHPMVTSYAILFTTATAASINLCCIILFNWLYVWLAEYLTEVIFFLIEPFLQYFVIPLILGTLIAFRSSCFVLRPSLTIA